MKKRTQIWSSGGGTQSTAIAALIVMGKLPKPDLAVIADTEREMSSTWDYIERYVQPALDSVGVTLRRVKKSQYATYDLYGGTERDMLMIPAFTTAGADGGIGRFPGYCSGAWKVDVMRRWAIREHGVKSADWWMGFTTDEMSRARRASASKKNQGKWQVVFPLIDLNMTRQDAINLVVNEMGWPRPHSSSCWMCPNHKMRDWRAVRNSPEDWRRAVQFDEYIRSKNPHLFLTAECVPLEVADLSDEQEVFFGNRGECTSGLCFV